MYVLCIERKYVCKNRIFHIIFSCRICMHMYTYKVTIHIHTCRCGMYGPFSLYMHVNSSTAIHIHMYPHTCIHTYIHTGVDVTIVRRSVPRTYIYTNIHAYRCGFDGCKKFPSFGDVDSGAAMYIHTYMHACIHAYRCGFHGCKKFPSFGDVDSGAAMYIHTYIHAYMHTGVAFTDVKSFLHLGMLTVG